MRVRERGLNTIRAVGFVVMETTYTWINVLRVDSRSVRCDGTSALK